MGVPELKPIEGKYEILEKLNEGGMGAVYKVQHRLLEEIRVIKVIRPQLQSDENLRRRFLREARAAVRLRHPNIAELYDFTVADDGTAYMVIEFIDGVDLVHVIQQSSLPAIDLVLDMAIQSLRALSYLHLKQFVHRDISPDNLMLTKDVEGKMLIKLIDMGIAKPLKSEMNLTGEGLFLGKVRYASPEQFGGQSGKEEIDHRSDLYSFGIVLYELLTGVHPITGTDNQTILAGHLFHPPRDFAETDPQNHVPEALRAIVSKALEKVADDRFPDAENFSNELASFGAQWAEPDQVSASLDATVIQASPSGQGSRPGSTQDRLDQEFSSRPTPPPQPLKAVAPSAEDKREALLQACCDKVESLIETKRLLEAEVEWQRGEKALGSSILLQELGERITGLREKVDEAVVRARLLQREGDLQAALDQVTAATTIDSENPEVAALLDEIGEALDRRGREIEAARKAIEVQLETGQLEEAQRRLEETQESFGLFAGLDDLQERITSLLNAAEQVRTIAAAADKVRQLIDAGKLHRARAALTGAVRTHGEDEMFTELEERIGTLERQEEEREKLAKETERRQQIKTYLEVAQKYLDAEDFPGALEQIERAALLDPDSPQIQAIQRRTKESQERHHLQHRRAVEFESLSAEFETHLESGNLDAAEKVVAAGRESRGETPELASLRARIDEIRLERRESAASERLKQAYDFFETGSLDEAAEQVSEALSLSPGFPQATKLQQKIVERRREDEQLQTLQTARQEVLEHLSAGRLDQAGRSLQAATKQQGAVRELQDLEKRLHDLRAREERRFDVQKVAQQIEKLIQKDRLDKASGALAEAVRAHGQDPVFDELRTRVEDIVGREQEAKEILATEVPRKPSAMRSRLGLAIAAALAVVVAIVVYSVRPSPMTQNHVAPSSQIPPEEPEVLLGELLQGRDIGRFYALVVGNNSYQMGLPDLETAVNDAQQLAVTLENRYGFETDLLINATRYETLSTLEGYIKRLEPADNLLIFYAGHGFVDNITGRGYWQPTDAEPDNTANWISSLEVADILFDVPAQRVLIVADSCFSGAFADNGDGPPAEIADVATGEEVLERLDSRSRRVLSSGSLQPVLDSGVDGHSVFSRALLAALDANPAAMESAELFQTVQQDVSAATAGMELQQLPQFAPLDSDKGGVFLFVPTQQGAG